MDSTQKAREQPMSHFSCWRSTSRARESAPPGRARRQDQHKDQGHRSGEVHQLAAVDFDSAVDPHPSTWWI
jgi:hypothetical protein